MLIKKGYTYLGDRVRFGDKFVWFPLKRKNGSVIWLEKVTVAESCNLDGEWSIVAAVRGCEEGLLFPRLLKIIDETYSPDPIRQKRAYEELGVL